MIQKRRLKLSEVKNIMKFLWRSQYIEHVIPCQWKQSTETIQIDSREWNCCFGISQRYKQGGASAAWFQVSQRTHWTHQVWIQPAGYSMDHYQVFKK